MKQSTKLLSLVLALLIAFSCMSVIGSATLVKNEVAYDTIDDADLSYQSFIIKSLLPTNALVWYYIGITFWW